MSSILVALDDHSEATQFVLESAIALAQSTSAKLTLLRVVTETVQSTVTNSFSIGTSRAVVDGSDTDVTNAFVANAQLDLLAYQEAVPVEYRSGTIVVVGRPHEAICEYARICNADMVIIGAHAYGLIDRMVGTTIAKIANHIDRPLLIIRPISATPAPVTLSSEYADECSDDVTNDPPTNDAPIISAENADSTPRRYARGV